jgi:hypothetical protein
MVWKHFFHGVENQALNFLPRRSLRSLARRTKRGAIGLAFALRLRLGLGTRLFHCVEKPMSRD